MNNFISFNGVDEKTDLKRLVMVQRRFPRIEFGVILSKNWKENGNRYVDPAILSNLRGLGLNLSAHLCGSVAREAIRDNWEPALELCGGNFDIFKRTQLNIARYDNNPEILNFDNIPDNIEEVIIQQKSAGECDLFREYNARTGNPHVVVLIDASGGSGKSLDKYELINNMTSMKSVKGRVGFAGGIGHHNVADVLYEMQIYPDNWWIDMESKVRTCDWFDLDKVSAVCGIAYHAKKMKPEDC